MISKYLSELGVKENSVPWNWNKDDARQDFWKEQRSVYGFDERDTWSLDYTIALLIYPRLKMYIDITKDDRESLKTILEGLEFVITKETSFYGEENSKKVKESFSLLGEILPSLWW